MRNRAFTTQMLCLGTNLDPAERLYHLSVFSGSTDLMTPWKWYMVGLTGAARCRWCGDTQWRAQSGLVFGVPVALYPNTDGP